MADTVGTIHDAGVAAVASVSLTKTVPSGFSVHGTAWNTSSGPRPTELAAASWLCSRIFARYARVDVRSSPAARRTVTTTRTTVTAATSARVRTASRARPWTHLIPSGSRNASGKIRASAA